MQAYMIFITMLLFLLITAFIYNFIPKNKRYILLLVSSLGFYGFYSNIGLVFLVVTIVTTYFFALAIHGVADKFDLTGLEKQEKMIIKAKIKSKKKLILVIYILINLGILLTLKYFNFFISSFKGLLGLFGLSVYLPVLRVLLPLGISYYTLQAIGYVIDVYRGKYIPEKNILKIGLFIGFYPQLYEGPFGRYDLLMPQLTKGDNINANNAYSGVYRILLGTFKIFMIANRACTISDYMFANYNKFGLISVILAIITFTIQLYAEFSGYIDIASGISKIFGIELTKNFDFPFISQSVGEFWRRWHISLGSWFRDYVFYSVSTSKVFSKIGKKLNNYKIQNTITIFCSMFAVWFLTGLWHGANIKYIVYGLYYLVLMLIYNYLNPKVNSLLEKKHISQDNKYLKGTRIAKTLILVGIGMMIFRASNLSVLANMIKAIFTLGTDKLLLSNIIGLADLFVLIISIIILIFISVLNYKNYDIEMNFNKLPIFKRYWICVAAICIIMIFGAYGLGYLPPDPIYGGF